LQILTNFLVPIIKSNEYSNIQSQNIQKNLSEIKSK